MSCNSYRLKERIKLYPLFSIGADRYGARIELRTHLRT